MKIRSFFLSLTAAGLFVPVVAVPSPMFAQAQQATAQPPAIAEFQKIEDQWSTALVKHDQFTLETILAPTYIDIASTGDITTRDQQVAALYEKFTPQPESMEQRVVNVRLIEDVAVVDGTYIEHTIINGIAHEERGVFTHVYQRARGTWLCVHSQRTAVIEKAPAKKEKKSEAGLPFHIPLLHKGSESSQPASQPAPQS